MERPVERPGPSGKLISGIARLYRASSRRDLYAYLRRFLADAFTEVSFSILVPHQSRNGFTLEYSTCLGVREIGGPLVVSPELAEILRAGEDRRFHEGERVALHVRDLEIPIKQVKVISPPGGGLGLMALHEDSLIEESPLLREGESFLFGQVFSAMEAAWERDGVHADLEQATARLEAMVEIGAALGQLELEVLLAHLIAVFARLTRAQVGSIVLERQQCSGAEWGLSREVLEKIRVRGGPSLRELAVQAKEPVFVRDYAGSPEYEPVEDFLVESVLCVPLVSKDRVLGTVSLVNSESAKGGKFNDTDRDVVLTISSLAATAIENGILHRELLEQERMKAGLQIAGRIQRGMYPQGPLKIPGYDVAWATRSCDETGGDYFDFFDCLSLENDRLALAMGDVSGHGIGAALLMAASRANLRALLSVKCDLKEIVDRMNDLLARDMEEDGSFMTLFLMYLDCERNAVLYANAGHDRPLVYRSEDSSVLDLASTGCALGMFPEMASGLPREQCLRPGDILLLTTDGVWEAPNRTGKQFGKQRLRAALAGHARKSAHEIVEGLFSDVEAFTGTSRPRDDQTVAVLKLLE
jgi:sigma-B regulation protein RsbU (phosphoserine phosphatase)